MRVLCINFFVKMITHADVSVLVGQGGGGGFSPLWWRWWRGRERRRVTTVTVGLAPLGNPYNFNLLVIRLASHLSWHAALFACSICMSLPPRATLSACRSFYGFLIKLFFHYHWYHNHKHNHHHSS